MISDERSEQSRGGGNSDGGTGDGGGGNRHGIRMFGKGILGTRNGKNNKNNSFCRNIYTINPLRNKGMDNNNLYKNANVFTNTLTVEE